MKNKLITHRVFNNSVAISQLQDGVAQVNAQSVSGNELTKRSADSAAMLDYWDLTDDIVAGKDAVKRRGEKYLPMFADETADDYAARLQQTKFTNIYRDIVESLAAKPFEEEISLVDGENKTPPEKILDFIEDVDGSGNNLTVFGASVFYNGINSAIDWIYVDYPIVDTNAVRTLADLKSSGIRPYWSRVLGRNVYEATTKIINGKETLTYMKICEPGTPLRFRVFERDDVGVVTWKLYEEIKDKTTTEQKFVVVNSGIISIGIIPLVPFYTGRRDGRTFKFFPAMRDAADLQIELYGQESALKFAKVMAAYPMLSGNGVKPQFEADGKTAKRLAVGPHRVLYGGVNGNGQVGTWEYVEPSSTSLKFLAEDVRETIQQLRELGRQPLTAQSGNLTVITTMVAAGKSRSAVSAWALSLKNALENALVITCMWFAIDDNAYSPEVSVFTEFDNFSDNGADMTALKDMRASGDLSQDQYWIEAKRRRVLSPEFDAEVERKRLLDEVPNGDGITSSDDPSLPKPKLAAV